MDKKKNSIRNKILISIIATTLLTTFVIAAMFYYKTSQMIEKNYTVVFQKRISQLSNTVDGMLQEVCDITINAACDDEIKQRVKTHLENEDEKELEKISDVLRLYCKENNAISSMYLLIPCKKEIVTSKDYPVYRGNLSQMKIATFLDEVKENSGPVILENLINPNEKVLSFVETVEDKNDIVMGYVCTNIEERHLYYDYVDDMKNADQVSVYLMNQGQILTSTKDSNMGDEWEDSSMSEEKIRTLHSEKDMVQEDSDNIYLYCKGAFSGCGVFAQVERKELLSDLNSLRKYVYGAVAVVLFASIFLALKFTNIVYEPVRRLTKAMKKVSEGELDTRVEVISQDETAIVATEFNRMLDQIQELIQQIIEEEKEKKDAELEALQYQITPHFMYNTLNSIKCAAMIKGERELAGVIEDFTELLQTCISKKGAFLTVAEEIQILENYIHLQEFRNGEEFQVTYNIAKEAEQCVIPRLILQPLVENALLHGFDLKKKKGILKISAWVLEERVYLEVADNGRGMSEEQIFLLLHSQSKKTKGLTAVGIPNVRDRLKLYYANEAELAYQSSSEGTKALIYIPLLRVGDEG